MLVLPPEIKTTRWGGHCHSKTTSWRIHSIYLVISFLSLIAVARCMIDKPAGNATFTCNLEPQIIMKEKYLYIEEKEHPVTLMTSRRIPHLLLTHAVAIILREYLGYANVVINYCDGTHPTHAVNALGIDSVPSDIYTESTYVPKAFVNLEIWFPPFEDHSSRLLSDAGLVSYLGLVGRMGWFFPEYIINKYDLTDIWRVFVAKTSPALRIFSRTPKELFDLKEFMIDPITKNYYCDSDHCEGGIFTPSICSKDVECAVLFASYYNISDFVISQIKEKSLYVKVAWLGPNLNMRFVANNEYFPNDRSVLFINDSPSTLSQSFNLTSIAFPYCTDDYQSFCTYEMYRLNKFIWHSLIKVDTFLYNSLEKISMSRINYAELISEYTDSKDINEQQVACNWLRKNKETWSQWSAGNSKPVLEIVGMFPIDAPSNKKFLAPGCVSSFEMAIDAINRDNTILPNHHLKSIIINTKCDADIVMFEFIEIIKATTMKKTYNKLVGIVGPACSDTVEPIAGVSKHFRIPIISYGAEGAIFTDWETYPYFFRTIPENQIFRDVYLQLFKKLDWLQIGSLTEDGHQYSEYLTPLQDVLQNNGFIFNMRKYPQETKNSKKTQYLQYLKQKRNKIIIGDFYQDVARDVICESIELGMTANEGYVWFLPIWYLDGWWDVDKIKEDNPLYKLPCSTEKLLYGLQGHMALSYKYFANDSSIMQENMSVGKWKKNYRNILSKKDPPVEESDYAGFTYDAVWTYAYALDKLFNEDLSYTSDLRSDKTINRFVHYLNHTNFNGVSGPINFTRGPSRLTDILIYQFTGNSYGQVGKFSFNPDDSSKGSLHLEFNKLKWPLKVLPSDGREKCMVESFRLSLVEGTDCTSAIIILCAIVFGSLAVLLILLAVFVKNRYEVRLQQLQDMMNRQSIYKEFKDWEIPRNKVVINRKLGEGEFGTVYGGECYIDSQGWQAAAVKTLKVGSTMTMKVDFLTEAEVMKNVNHENIVKLIGVCTESEPIYTVMEFMLYGDLKTFLLARRNLVNEKTRNDYDEVSNRRLTSMALDVAKAMTYLAEMKYVHRDIACRNCLVNAHRSVKLADFGLTRPIVEKNYYRFNRKGLLPVRWMAPESLLDGVFTPMSDIWSYGVLLYEIVTFGAFPFLGLNNNQVFERIKAGYTLPIPPGIKPDLESLMQACWHSNSAQRISASLVVLHLQSCPRLITPCLDTPQSAVTIENPVGLELRKLSLALNSGRNVNNQAMVMGGVGGSTATGFLNNRTRSMSGNMVIPPFSSNLCDDTANLSSNLDALNLIEETGDDPLLPPSQYISTSRFKSLSNKDLERERELLVKKKLLPSIWTNITPV